MNPAPDTLDDTAARWAWRLSSGPLTAVEASSLADWLGSDPANASRLDSFREIHASLTEAVPAMVRAGELPDFSTPKVIHSPRALFRRFAAGAAFAAALVLGAFWYVGRPEPFVTVAAQRSSVTFADGSHVDLNARTSLAVQLRGAERHVRLNMGEAYFAVAHDGRPFFVETAAGTVRVTGTAFNVRSPGSGQLEVTVLEGSVVVTPTAGRLQPLSPQEQLSIDGGKVTSRKLSPGSAQDVIAWREGRLVCEGEPLALAVQAFARYHGREISLAPELAALELGGRFKLDELDDFLDGIEVALPVRVLRSPGGPIRIVAR